MDRHDAGNDGDSNAYMSLVVKCGYVCRGYTFRAHFVYPLQEVVDIVEELCDDELCTCINLLFQLVQLNVFICIPVRMSVGVGWTALHGW